MGGLLYGPEDDVPTYVYQAFDAEGVLLYVGISSDWKTRIYTQHRRKSPWYPMADWLLLELYESRAQAFAAESWAITYYDPKWNSEAQWKHCPFIPPDPIWIREVSMP